jgi:hypothetical protein
LTWTGCGTHGLDLFLEDVGKLDWAKEPISEVHELVKFISNHHKSLAIFRKHSELQLLRPADTRFTTAYIMVERVIEVRHALEETVVDAEWRTWSWRGSASLRDEADEVKSTVSSLSGFHLIRPAFTL